MKANAYLNCLLLLPLIVTGCASAGARSKAINNAAAPIVKQKADALDGELTAAKTSIAAKFNGAAPIQPAPGITQDVMQGRVDAYGRLQKQKDELDAKFSVCFDENQHRADKIGAWKTGIGIGGVAAGVTAAALTAASPANAVWVIVFSGCAGSVAGMNGVFDNNGFSREQIAALETTVAQEYAKVSAAIDLEVLLSIAVDQNTTSEKWQTELSKRESALIQLQALALTLRIPTGASKAATK